MKVTGKITDAYGDLGGATVVLLRDNERTNVATTTDDDGTFTIENESIEPTDIFEIRFLGTKPQYKKASDLQDANIFMEENVEQFDEVVITNDVGKKPKESNAKKWEQKWYNSPVFLLSSLALVTTGVIIYIVKKSK